MVLALLLFAETPPATAAETRRGEVVSISIQHGLDRRGHARRAGHPQGFRLRALGRDLDVVLERNKSLIAAGAKVVLVGDDRREFPLRAGVWSGHVVGDPTSVVRASIEGGSIRATVRDELGTFVIEPSDAQGSAMHTVASAQDILATQVPLACDAVESESGAGIVRNSFSTRTATSSLRLLEVSVVVDAALYRRFGDDTAGYVQELFNQVDGVYREQLGLAVQIRQIVIYTTEAAQPFVTTGVTTAQILESLSVARLSDSTFSMSAGDVTHLLVGSELFGTLGTAWVNGVCDAGHGAGVSQITARPGYLETVLVAHEIGHNLGAMHDGQAGSGCETAAAGWIMWPSIYSGIRDEFSDCSLSSIERKLSLSACIDDAIPAGCGDGVLDPSEECDDGNTSSGDCCRLNCTFDLAGLPCGASDEACYDHVCDGGGTCMVVANSAACDSDDACMDARCAAGECLSTGELRAFSQVEVRFRVNGDGIIESGRLRATAPLAPGASNPSTAGLLVQVVVAGVTVYDEFLAPEAWVENRTGIHVYKTSDRSRPVRKASVAMVPDSGAVSYRISLELPLHPVQASAAEIFLLAGDRLDGQCSGTIAGACGPHGSKYVCTAP